MKEPVEATPIPNPQSPIPAAQYVWGDRYVDDLVLRDRDTDANGSLDERLYAMQDPNWNMIAVTNTSGAVQDRYSYSAYGTPTFMTSAFAARDPNASSYAWDALYTGRQYDPETGLYHYRMRSYGAELGRLVTRDPIEADSNLYAYVRDNPVLLVDPAGLFCSDADVIKKINSCPWAKKFVDGFAKGLTTWSCEEVTEKDGVTCKSIAGYAPGKSDIIVSNDQSCDDMAATIIHEGLHARQSSSMTRVDAEIDAYRFETAIALVCGWKTKYLSRFSKDGSVNIEAIKDFANEKYGKSKFAWSQADKCHKLTF